MKRLIGAAAALALMLPGAAVAQDTIKVGILVALEGAFAAGGADGVRNVELALKQAGGMAGGKKIETVVAATDTTPATATRMARKLIEQDKVDIIPGKTVINGTSGALETTWVDPAPNFFRFNLDGAQWGTGLGAYVVQKKNWKRVAAVSADYSFGYTNFLGFAVDFCKAGGEIAERLWVPLGSGDYAGVIAKLPDNVDAIYLGMGGTDAINFLNQYQQAGGKANLIGGSIMADPTVLSSKGKAKDALVGTPTSGAFAVDNPAPEWQSYLKAYRDAWPADQRQPSPTLFGVGYYVATLAMVAALNEVKGDLSDGQKKFNAALSKLKLQTPLGIITLNENRQATGPVFVNEVIANADGTLSNKMVSKVENVNQTLGMTPDAFRAMGLPSRTTPDCKALGGK
jgi:branched-chain amino acid transport system substrate-binding protein